MAKHNIIWTPKKIISGGQSGVDRAALDAAQAAGIPHGGWCPKGRLAEDGIIDGRYRLRETPGSDARERTRRNVREADGTLVLVWGKWEDAGAGTVATCDFCRQYGKALLVVDMGNPCPVQVRSWGQRCAVEILNVAGPRQSFRPRIYSESLAFFRRLF